MNLTELITLSLHEDIQDGDITTQLFVDPNATADANIIANAGYSVEVPLFLLSKPFTLI